MDCKPNTSSYMPPAQIPFAGKILTVAQLTPYKQDPNRAVRKAAFEAEGRFFDENRENSMKSMITGKKPNKAGPPHGIRQFYSVRLYSHETKWLRYI